MADRSASSTCTISSGKGLFDLRSKAYMNEKNEKLEATLNELNEHITAVKGTLELIDASVEEDDLHNLVLKALKRMDTIYALSGEMFTLLKACLQKMRETNT
jgi:hypothetical protein